jgi:acyl carrier protein
MATPSASDPSDELVRWLCGTIARACHLAPESVTAQSSVLDLDLDSLTLVSVLTQVETAHGLELSPDDTLMLLEATTVGVLARELAAIISGRATIRAPG